MVYFVVSNPSKNTANQRPGKPLHILRYPPGSIQRVVFHLAFTPLLASVYRSGAKTVCVSFRNGANVIGQICESFLHKVKLVLETWEVKKKLMKNSQIFQIFHAWDKLVSCIF